MNRHHKIIIRGFLSGVIISVLANLITFGHVEYWNVLASGLIGVIVHGIFEETKL